MLGVQIGAISQQLDISRQATGAVAERCSQRLGPVQLFFGFFGSGFVFLFFRFLKK